MAIHPHLNTTKPVSIKLSVHQCWDFLIYAKHQHLPKQTLLLLAKEHENVSLPLIISAIERYNIEIN